MADPFSVAVSSLAVVTAALQTATALYKTVQRFKERNKTLSRLQDTTQDLIDILQSLKEAIDGETQMSTLLQGPVERCHQICYEFEQSMLEFDKKPRVGIIDWAKMEFMRGDINDFMDTLAGYKLTISVGLGTVNLCTAKAIPEQVREKFIELVRDTTFTLELQLQRIDAKMTQITGSQMYAPKANINLEDEKAVTEQCLRVCQDARSYIASLADREATVLDQTPVDSGQGSAFEAPLRTRQTLNASQEQFAETIIHLQRRLHTLVNDGDDDNEAERQRLEADIRTSKQCLEVCKLANDISHEKEYRLGEVAAEGESDQVVVNTYSDLFVVKKASTRGKAAQLLASTDVEGLRLLAQNRYSSSFGRFTHDQRYVELGDQNSRPIFQGGGSQDPGDAGAGVEQSSKGSTSHSNRSREKPPPGKTDRQPSSVTTSQDTKPSSNEVRKRQSGSM